MTRILVGSTNPVKVAATERAVASLPGTRVAGVGVESGVSDQPRGTAETMAGAENRARRALDAGDAVLGVGIEGGVAALDHAPGRWLIMWAAVTDGDRLERGGGPSFRLPEPIADRIRAGEELGPVLDDLLGTEGIKERGGAAAVLTGEVVDRESALTQAVAGALGPFVTDHY